MFNSAGLAGVYGQIGLRRFLSEAADRGSNVVEDSVRQVREIVDPISKGGVP